MKNSLFELLQNYLTPTIGVLTVINLVIITYVAYQQYLLRKEILEYQIHKDLYDRRLKVFQETMEMLRTIVNTQKPQWTELMTVLRRIEDDAYFLFGNEIHEYIYELKNKAIDKKQLNKKIDRLNKRNDPEKEQTRLEAIDKELDLDQWLISQFDVCKDKFSKYLSYEEHLK